MKKKEVGRNALEKLMDVDDDAILNDYIRVGTTDLNRSVEKHQKEKNNKGKNEQKL